MRRPLRCVYCRDSAVGGSLCRTCRLGLDKYPEQNEVIVRAYIDAGHPEIEALLARHAEFYAWLLDHGGSS